MEDSDKQVIGGRLYSMFEGTLKLVFQDGELQKGSEHRHSCGGKVSLIVMSTGVINAGAILTCNTCNWRYVFDPQMLTDGNISKAGHHRLLTTLFGQGKRNYYCINCMINTVDHTMPKCQDCLRREVVNDNGSEIKT